MKILKPIMFVMAGIAIALLVSFKNEEPVKEYATLYTNANEAAVYFSDGTEKTMEYKYQFYRKEINKIVNDLAKDGWKIIEVTNSSTSLWITVIYLERAKR